MDVPGHLVSAATGDANLTRLCTRGGVIERPNLEPRLLGGDKDEDRVFSNGVGDDDGRRQAVDGEGSGSGCTRTAGGRGGERKVEYAAPPGSHMVFVSGPWEKRPQFP